MGSPEQQPTPPQAQQSLEAAEAAQAKKPEQVATLLNVREDYPKAADRLQDETGEKGAAVVEKRLAALSALPPFAEAKPGIFKNAAAIG